MRFIRCRELDFSYCKTGSTVETPTFSMAFCGTGIEVKRIQVADFCIQPVEILTNDRKTSRSDTNLPGANGFWSALHLCPPSENCVRCWTLRSMTVPSCLLSDILGSFCITSRKLMSKNAQPWSSHQNRLRSGGQSVGRV